MRLADAHIRFEHRIIPGICDDGNLRDLPFTDIFVQLGERHLYSRFHGHMGKGQVQSWAQQNYNLKS